MTDAVTVTCARCGGIAAEFSFVERGGLRRKGFLGETTKFGERRLFELIRVGDLAAARGADADFVAFYCRKCSRSYCERCWRIGPPEFDEGFYDCTSGTCPEGHEQILDD